MNYKENEDYIGLDELDARLFDCADVLRGSVDKGRYKDRGWEGIEVQDGD